MLGWFSAKVSRVLSTISASVNTVKKKKRKKERKKNECYYKYHFDPMDPPERVLSVDLTLRTILESGEAHPEQKNWNWGSEGVQGGNIFLLSLCVHAYNLTLSQPV